MPASPDIGRLLRRHRAAVDLTLAEVADRLGDVGLPRARQSVHAWEVGRARPPVEALAELVIIYELNRAQIYALYQAAGILVIMPPEAA